MSAPGAGRTLVLESRAEPDGPPLQKLTGCGPRFRRTSPECRSRTTLPPPLECGREAVIPSYRYGGSSQTRDVPSRSGRRTGCALSVGFRRRRGLMFDHGRSRRACRPTRPRQVRRFRLSRARARVIRTHPQSPPQSLISRTTAFHRTRPAESGPPGPPAPGGGRSTGTSGGHAICGLRSIRDITERRQAFREVRH